MGGYDNHANGACICVSQGVVKKKYSEKDRSLSVGIEKFAYE
jgi:hypothetical protein